jgi:seryl-tRNA synthetase
MLSLQFIRENPDIVRKAIADKGARIDLDALLALDGEVRAMKSEVDELRRQRNEISAGFKSAAPEERPALGARAKEVGARS